MLYAEYYPIYGDSIIINSLSFKLDLQIFIKLLMKKIEKFLKDAVLVFRLTKYLFKQKLDDIIKNFINHFCIKKSEFFLNLLL